MTFKLNLKDLFALNVIIRKCCVQYNSLACCCNFAILNDQHSIALNKRFVLYKLNKCSKLMLNLTNFKY